MRSYNFKSMPGQYMTLMYHIVLLRHQAEKAGIPFLPTSPFRGNREQDEQIELPLRATDDSSARFEANTIATQYQLDAIQIELISTTCQTLDIFIEQTY